MQEHGYQLLSSSHDVADTQREAAGIAAKVWSAIFNDNLLRKRRKDTKVGREAVYAILPHVEQCDTIGPNYACVELPSLVKLGLKIATHLESEISPPTKLRLNICGYIRTKKNTQQTVHRDIPFESNKVAFSVFVGVSMTNGEPTLVCPGSHKRQVGQNTVPVSLREGEVLVLDSRLLHAGGGCGTGAGRVVAFFSLVPVCHVGNISYIHTYPGEVQHTEEVHS